MDARVVQIAKAVQTALRDAALSQSVSVERKYLPVLSQRDMGTTITVTVVPTGDDWSTDSRDSHQEDIEISVVVRAKVAAGSRQAQVDGLVKLVEEIKDALQGPMGGATWIRSSTEVLNQSMLEEKSVFQSVTRSTYRGIKSNS